jgi:hypothetical protein
MKRFSRGGPVSGGTMRMPASGAIHDMRIEKTKIGSPKRNMMSKVSLPYLIQRRRCLRKGTSDYKGLSNVSLYTRQAEGQEYQIEDSAER